MESKKVVVVGAGAAGLMDVMSAITAMSKLL